MEKRGFGREGRCFEMLVCLGGDGSRVEFFEVIVFFCCSVIILGL